MKKKVYICCPGDSITGGPELLHQFCEALGENGVDASMVYYPFDVDFALPKQYLHYNVSVANFRDIDKGEKIVIIPEVETKMISLFTNSTICVWWMSVDNYFAYKKYPLFVQRYIGHPRSVLLQRRLPIFAMKKYLHLSQSEYSTLFLKSKGIASEPLSDYLNAAHLNDVNGSVERENIICYNPKKGVVKTNQLISSFPGYKFVPIQNMSAAQVRELLEKSKVYIDFGPHPGKDRFPREAVMAGSCIITGIRGSAENSVDVAIPKKYKIDESAKDFTAKFGAVVDEIFSNYEASYADFENYKLKISREYDEFKLQVKNFADKHCK